MAGHRKKGPAKKRKRRRKSWQGGNRFFHAKARARKHYGIILEDHDIQTIADLLRIERGEYIKASEHGTNRGIYTIDYHSTVMTVVYDRPCHVIVTILPPEV